MTKGNHVLQKTISHYKQLVEKSDQSEKIRQLNEQIVSLKIQLSVSILISIAFEYTTSANRALGVWAEIWGERISWRPLSQPGSI